MCFSANASLGAGVVLTVIGIASMKKAQHPSQLLFTSIPLLFGVQQLAEGILWLTIPNPAYAATQKIATCFYLFFAHVLWPMCIPLSIALLEANTVKRKIQKYLAVAGCVVGLYLAYCLFAFHVEAKIVGHHITYMLEYPRGLRIYFYVLYGLVTILPPFFSNIRRMWWLGLSILVSYIIAAIFYEHYVLSVWCFFAAIISLSVYAIVVEISRTGSKPILVSKQFYKIN